MENQQATNADKTPVPVKTGLTVHMHCPACDYDSTSDVNWYITQALKQEPAVRKPFGFDCIGCDAHFDVTVTSATELSAVRGPVARKYGLMLVKHHSADTYLIVEDYVFDSKHIDLIPFDTDKEYYINEHTCPTNWLDVRLITSDGDPDPHGVFQFVRFRTYEEIEAALGYPRSLLRGEGVDSNDEDEALQRVFPECVSGGNVFEAASAHIHTGPLLTHDSANDPTHDPKGE